LKYIDNSVANDPIKGNKKSINAQDIFNAIKKMDLDTALMPKLEPAVAGIINLLFSVPVGQ
jgi:hypothetical protein